MIEAKILADSINEQGDRLTTFQVTFHRFILPEFNTHRVFSRNFRSSRAVPTSKLIKEVRTNPAMPVFWGKNQAGMQAHEELGIIDRDYAKNVWIDAAIDAAENAEKLATSGVHKQIVNRLLEPFLYVHGVVSATEWMNFFGLRLHKDAQPEFRTLAEAMWNEYKTSVPIYRDNSWHLPYITEEERNTLSETDSRDISMARCARVSYKSFDTDKPSTIEEDRRLCSKLMGSAPLHASPAEHQALPDGMDPWVSLYPPSNFTGWLQYRKMFPNELCKTLPENYEK